jgi:hypothetical protein
MKYAPLREHLTRQGGSEIPMTFDEIQNVVGRPLPEKAALHRAWWSNNPSNNVMTKAWLEAGYKTERVDMSARKLVFRRASRTPPAAPPTPAAGSNGKAIFKAMHGALKGTVTINVDLTLPTDEPWAAQG